MSTTTAEKMLTRASAVSGSLNLEARTIDVTFATEAPVRRRDWETGVYDEVLLCGRDNVDLSRADNMSLLDTHGASSLDDRLGSVIPGSIRFENGRVVATVKLSRRAKAEELLQDLQDGHGLPISVGYRITHQERTEAEPGGIPTIRATRWQPMEISVVPIPADPNARTRGIDMPEPTTTEPVRQEQPTQYAIRKERTRVTEIRFIARSAGLDDEEVDAAIENGTSLDQFRNRAFEHMVAEQAKSPTFPHVRAPEFSGRCGNGDVRRAMAEAIFARINPGHEPSAQARQFIGLPLAELARDSLRQAGVSVTGMGASEVISRSLGGMHTTSDFALALGDVVGRVVSASYAAAPSGLKPLAREVTLPDFRRRTFIRMSGLSDLQRVGEHGEFKRGTVEESGESVKLETFGKVFGMSRQAIVNDDLGALSDIPSKLGEAAARFEADRLAAALVSNPVMSDGVALFHATHGNLAGSGGALSETTLSAARLAMRGQKDSAGFLISVQPKYLVVGPELETAAEKLLATIAPATTGDVQPIKLSLVVEPRLVGNAWYVVDPAVDGLVFAHLAGEPGPQIETRAGFDVDGVETRVRLDFGAAFIDHRAWYKNPGV